VVDDHLQDDGGVAPPSPAKEASPTAARVARLVRDRAQAHLVTGVSGLRLVDQDRFALEVLVSSLSGQGGRLFLELRDKQSLCYSVAAYAVDGLEPGSFSVYMGTSPEKVDQALAGIDQILATIVAEGITENELVRAKRYLLGSHAIGLQRSGARATTMVLNQLYGLGHLAHIKHQERLGAVTLDDVRAVAKKILTRPRITSVVGPEGTGGPSAT
ncbi:MAG TPA: insulinase family protein, partial [Myxococcota bacterium]